MKQKTFWQRPEGFTGGLVLTALLAGAAILLYNNLPALLALAQNTLYLSLMMGAVAAVAYIALDPKARALFWYMYKAFMRWITGLFVQINPIAILKSYIDNLEDNLRNLSKQIGALRGQMRRLKGTMDENNAEIRKSMATAEQAKTKNDDKNLALATRRAGRLQEANAKYDVLYQKMEVLYRILTKMYENSEIVLEDTRDQVRIREQEYRAIQAGHSAIQSAMSILKGDPDRKAMFDQALESLTDEVSAKVGEMERFMDTSRNLMASIDLQNGVFEEEGLQLLEKWERESPLLTATDKPLDLSQPPTEIRKEQNGYDRLFD